MNNPTVEDIIRCLEGAERIPAGDWPGAFEGKAEAGLYAWYVDGPGSEVLRAGLGLAVKPGLLYSGQTGATKWPSGKPSRTTLHGRIGRNHLRGRVRGSTFRLSLGAVLVWPLGLEVVGPKLLTPESEVRISRWMSSHLVVIAVPVADRDALGALEAQVVRALDPPFNLDRVPPSPVRLRLRELRGHLARGERRPPPD